jgi:hypothetical protein
MYDTFGASYAPQTDSTRQRQTRPGTPVQQAVQVLSLRLPRVLGGRTPVPRSLLTAVGGGSNAAAAIARKVQGMPGVDLGRTEAAMSGAPPTAPQAPRPPLGAAPYAPYAPVAAPPVYQPPNVPRIHLSGGYAKSPIGTRPSLPPPVHYGPPPGYEEFLRQMQQSQPTGPGAPPPSGYQTGPTYGY